LDELQSRSTGIRAQTPTPLSCSLELDIRKASQAFQSESAT